MACYQEDYSRAKEVLLELNKAERHIRGGKATQMKYKAIES